MPAGWSWSQRPLRDAEVAAAPRVGARRGRRWSLHRRARSTATWARNSRAMTARADLDDLLDGQHARQVARRPRTAPASAPRGAWPRCAWKRSPAVSWPVTRPTTSMTAKVSRYCTSDTANDKRGGDEEEVERGHVDERREHRRPAARAARATQHHRQQEQHHDVGEVEVRHQQRAPATRRGGADRQRPAVAANAARRRRRRPAPSARVRRRRGRARCGCADLDAGRRRAPVAPARCAERPRRGHQRARLAAAEHELGQVVLRAHASTSAAAMSCADSIAVSRAELLRELDASAGCARAGRGQPLQRAASRRRPHARSTVELPRQPRRAAHHVLGARRAARCSTAARPRSSRPARSTCSTR